MMSSLAGLLLGLSESRLAMILAGMTVTTAVALVCARLARRSRASVRHLWLVSAFAVLGLLPIASVVIPSIQIAVPVVTPDAAVPVTAPLSGTTPAGVAVLAVDSGDASGPTRRPAVAISIIDIVIAVWTVGVALALVPIVIGLLEVRSLRRTSTPWLDAGADVLRSRAIRGPVTFGVFRPVIVVPVDARDWPPEDLERALVHEREHIRRWDWLSLVCARAISAVYWFHPLVWVARRRLELEAERACDDAVIRHEAGRTDSADATAYADQLVVLAQRLSSASRSPLLAMANRADLAARVGSLLDSRQRRGRAGLLAVVAASTAAALLVTTMSTFKLVAAPQSSADAQAPAFEVVSIKPCAPGDVGAPAGGRGGGGGAATSPGRLTIQCSTVINLINRAYVSFGNPPPINHANTPGNNIIQGAPAWANSEKYAIEAKAEGTPDITTMNGPMLRRLLQERFQLRVHEDVKDVSALALTIAPSGLKITSVDPSSCIESSPNNPGPRVMRTSPSGTPLIFAADAGPDAKPYCTVGISTKAPNIQLDVTGMTLQHVVRTLSSLIVDRPVVDRTGATGQYSFHLEFGPDENIRTPATMTPSDLPPGPSIFVAVEKQLGLKLTPTRAPQASLIVDHLERPSDLLSLDNRFAPASADQGGGAQRFDVVSIKPCDPQNPVPPVGGGARQGGGSPIQASPNRLTVNCSSVDRLIAVAYVINGEALLNNQPSGGADKQSQWIRNLPEWASKQAFAIEAEAPRAVDRALMLGPMLRGLLEDRFKLTLHRGDEEVPMYSLVVAKSGLKMKPIGPDGCIKNDGGAGFGSQEAAMENARAVAAGELPPRCSSMTMFTGTLPGSRRWILGGETMERFAQTLSTRMDRNVIDKTGVADMFNIRIEFAEGDASPAPPLAKALEEQLGLKLEPTRDRRAFLVVDRIVIPAPNSSLRR